MEESKELQSLYKLFRFLIYISIIVEIAAYAFTPDQVDTVGKILFDIWSRVKRWTVYADGNIIYSKLMTFLIVVITCVGTRNKKQLEFDMRTMVLYPFVGGILLLICAVVAYYCFIPPYLWVWSTNIWIYIVLSIIGTVLIHVALDNISKYLKEGLMKDRFNFENESFEQCTELVETDYSVNIPMKFYYKKKFRDGWVNISNPFRGRRRTNRAISVKLIHWLKLNVNNLKSAIWVKQRKITENIRKGMTSGWLGTSVGNYRFCFPEFPTNLRTLNGLNSIILSQFGMCK